MANKHEQQSRHTLKDLVAETTTKEQFEAVVEQLLPSSAKEKFGPEAKQKVVHALLYLIPFATGPTATMDEEALQMVWEPESEEELATLIESMKELGVLETVDIYLGPTEEKDKKDQATYEKMGLKHVVEVAPRPRHVAKNRLRITDAKLLENLRRIAAKYE